jgi:putative membrane protein
MSRTNKTAVLTLLATLCVAPAGHAITDPTNGMDSVDKSAVPEQSSPTFFLKEAAGNGMAEVELGKLAQQRASSSAVKAFGQQMVTDHTKANEQVQALAAAKKIDLPTTLDSKHAALRDQLASKNGVEFDQAYMDEMANDHKKVIQQFSDAAKESTDKDVKEFAANTLPVLQGHLEKATAIEASLPQARATQ